MPEPGGACPTIGVGIPTWNEARALPRLLERLCDEEPDDRPDEVVVADGGSADLTAALARERGVTVVTAPLGRGRQLAAAARRLEAEVLFFLHADCMPAPGAIAVARRAFREPALEWAVLRQEIEAEGLFYRCVERAAALRARAGLVYGDSGLLVRRSAYHAVGGYRALPVFEDLDLALRLRRRAAPRMLAGARLFVSARRWQREGALRCTLRNWMLLAGFLAGRDPEHLARRYPKQADIEP